MLKRVDTTEQKTTGDLARELLLGELMASAMRQLRALDKPWLRLPEHQQRVVIESVKDDVERAVHRAVEIIATDDRTRFQASVESVTFKDGVKAVMTMANSEASHELADTAGGRVFIVIEDPNRYTQDNGNLPKTEPDQRPLTA